MFESIERRPPDPILGLSTSFKKDENPNKIDLGVGVYKDESGITPVMDAVKQAEHLLWEQEDSKAYIAQEGPALYNQHTASLLFGDKHSVLNDGRSSTILAPGGSGSLRLAAEFINNNFPGSTIWVSDPTWANHIPLLSSAGLKLEQYPYYDYSSHEIKFDQMMKTVGKVKKGDLLLLHGCCHNPCGADLNKEQWQAVTDASGKQGFTPFIDLAYQGLGDGLDEDVYGLRLMAEQLPELIVASSYSKNFGLYKERVGAVTLVNQKSSQVQACASQIVSTARQMYSVPPAHGASLVGMILDDPALRSCWVDELTTMRDRINGLRKLLAEKLSEKGVGQDFSFICQEKGMFSFLGLSVEQVQRLINEFSIYLVNSSRINVAGISSSNIDYLVDSLAEVL